MNQTSTSNKNPQMHLSKPTLKRLDHYNLICEDAEAVADFHIRYLGYSPMKILDMNTSGSADANDIDTKNIKLRAPHDTGPALVVTGVLNDKSVFSRYMKKFGPNVHHIAFEVEDIEGCFAYCQSNGIQTTTDEIIVGLLSGNKQFFIKPNHAGFFIELVERIDPSELVTEESNNQDSFGEEEEEWDEDTPKDHSDKGFNPERNLDKSINSINQFLLEAIEDDPTDFDPPQATIDTMSMSTLSLLERIDDIDVGPMKSIGFHVENINESMKFLIDTFNLRFARYDASLGRAYMTMYNADDTTISLFLQETTEKTDIGLASVYHSILEQHSSTYDQSSFSTEQEGEEKKLEQDDEATSIFLPRDFTTYNVNLCSEATISSKSSIVDICNLSNTMSTFIHRSQKDVIDFISNPSNLSSWTTSFKSNSTSCSHDSSSTGSVVVYNDKENHSDNEYIITKTDKSVMVRWLQRKLSVIFLTSKGTSNITHLSAVIYPSTIKKRGNRNRNRNSSQQLGNEKKNLGLEFNLLKAALEDTVACIPEQ